MEFEHRLNKLYTHPLLGDLLDNGEIDFALLDVLSQLARAFSKQKSAALDPNYTEEWRDHFTDDSHPTGRIFQALLDLNILYKSKHYDMLFVEHSFYVSEVLEPYVARIYSRLTRRERLHFWLYKRAKGIKLGTQSSGLPFLTETSYSNRGVYNWSKQSPCWEFGELYYKLEPADTHIVSTAHIKP